MGVDAAMTESFRKAEDIPRHKGLMTSRMASSVAGGPQTGSGFSQAARRNPRRKIGSQHAAEVNIYRADLSAKSADSLTEISLLKPNVSNVYYALTGAKLNTRTGRAKLKHHRSDDLEFSLG